MNRQGLGRYFEQMFIKLNIMTYLESMIYNHLFWCANMTDCPCGSKKSVDVCCQKFISGNALPDTPEELMRSRYTAYTLCDINYIEKTMLAPANNQFDAEATKQWSQQVNWLKLEVLNSSIQEDKGTVEFCAHFMFENKKHLMHEISEFIKKDGKWYYVNGIAPANPNQVP